MVEKDLFGHTVDPFATALERYGVWPTTVWEVDYQDRGTRDLKALIGDIGYERPEGSTAGKDFTRLRGGRVPYASERNNGSVPLWGHQTRAGAFTAPADDESVYRGKVTASIFNPAVAAWLLNCFAPAVGHVFDPFAGGGTRAIMAAKRGLTYLGTEIRAEEVLAVRARLAACGVTAGVTIQHGDARTCDAIAMCSADFCLTCPPYWNLEQYNGGPDDLSMIESYPRFLAELGRVIAQTHRILKPGALSCWVVGLHRRETTGELTALHHDVTRLHQAHGFTLREEIILSQKGNGAIQRVGNFEKGERRLVRTHEYALVFRAT